MRNGANNRYGSVALRRNNILVRVNQAEKDGFRAAANLAGISLSAWIRERLQVIAASELKGAEHSIVFHDVDRVVEG
jgi:hypothetical protein